MSVRLHKGDLPDLSRYTGRQVAIDTETMGLNPMRDRLCVVQLLADETKTKLFHFARFDMAALFAAFGVMTTPVYCTKIASKLVRTYTDRHGLKDLSRELLGVDMSKQQQSSDWGAETLSQAQLDYAASDVLYLHDLRRHLDRMLAREGRADMAKACFEFLPTRAQLDLAGWPETDIFAHS